MLRTRLSFAVWLPSASFLSQSLPLADYHCLCDQAKLVIFPSTRVIDLGETRREEPTTANSTLTKPTSKKVSRSANQSIFCTMSDKTPQSTHPSLYELLLGPIHRRQAQPGTIPGSRRESLRLILNRACEIAEESLEELELEPNKPKRNKSNEGPAPPSQ